MGVGFMIYWISYMLLCTFFFVCVLKYMNSEGDDVTLRDILIGLFICYIPILNIFALIGFFNELQIFDMIIIKGKKIDNEEQE